MARVGKPSGGKGEAAPHSLWLSPNPSKRWTELFFLAYSPFWIVWALGIIVRFGIYEHLDEYGYLAVGLFAGLPCFLIPFVIEGKADRGRPFYARFWFKANVWLFIFSFIGNYFWTHYFYTLLGAKYTFPSWRLNDVPIPLYLLTHAYFCFYHTVSNVLLRRVWRALLTAPPLLSFLVKSVAVLVLAYITAFMETLTIAHFPYYTFTDKDSMYKIGSLFYGIYFLVSFPMFLRLEDNIGEEWSVGAVALDSLAAGMLVTIILDAWRLYIGPIAPRFAEYQTCGAANGIPWVV